MGYSRVPAKVDGNQTVIVKALRAIGCSVQSLAAVGCGEPTILKIATDAISRLDDAMGEG